MAVIHGQRHEDQAPLLGMSGWTLPPVVEVAAPLADWSSEEVIRLLSAENVALPEHYTDIADSLDCWTCPAAFGEGKGSARAAYMRKAYPQLLDAVMPGVRRTLDAVRASLEGLELAIDRAGPDRDADPAFVMQWAPLADDCMVAALATVLGRSYAETATILGVPLDPATGQPTVLKDKGLTLADFGGPMLSISLSATTIVSTAAGGTLEQVNVRRHLTGRPAVLGVEVDKDDGSEHELHALAWTGTRLFDCRGPKVRELRIEDVTILAATVITYSSRDLYRRSAGRM
ncbi:MAG: hypothetical protein EOO81_01240 [Oxalobacteraceae bacterium]|nr:MAG: hypothetical protein EOO81_01240 [Oxalobacteraceae bacterium]